jgi:hypothetical protein
MSSLVKKAVYHMQRGTWAWVISNIFHAAVQKADQWMLTLGRDAYNRLKYGAGAPTYCERIWVDPQKIDRLISNEEIIRVTGMHRNRASGRVVDWSKIQEFLPLMEQCKMKFCFRHWKDGVSWEELGYYDFMGRMVRHRMEKRQQIMDRFAMLDEAFESARRTGTLKMRCQINPSAFREEGGILIHIGPGGTPFFGGNGFHRLAIAKVLNLPRIPVCMGVVDKDSIPFLKQYRR